MATATKKPAVDSPERLSSVPPSAEVLAHIAKQEKAKRDGEPKGLWGSVLATVEDFIDSLPSEEERKKARALAVPTDASKELVHASWGAASEVTKASVEAYKLRATNPAAAKNLQDKAVEHFAAIRLDRPEVYAGAMLVLTIQAEAEYEKSQA